MPKQSPSANGYFTMKEACRRLRLSPRTLLRKEKSGEIPPLPRDPRNGYRRFTEEDILRLQLILSC
jgi:DNA-binding transcriptional MerR regulator